MLNDRINQLFGKQELRDRHFSELENKVDGHHVDLKKSFEEMHVGFSERML
jgi:hypothetical protein